MLKTAVEFIQMVNWLIVLSQTKGLNIVIPHVNGFGSGENTMKGIESCWSELKRLANQSQRIQPNNEDPLSSLQAYGLCQRGCLEKVL